MRNILLSILFITAVSCNVDSTRTGTSFFNEGVLDYSYSDTSSVALSTIWYEKLSTVGSTRLLTGTNNDALLGRITAAPYFQVMPSGAVDLRNVNSALDYLTLTLKYDEYSYYDTAQALTLNVFAVQEEIALDDNGYLYTYNGFKLGDQLGTITFKPRPHSSDSIEIRMPDAMAQDFYNKAKNAATEFSTTTDFLKYFHGLAVVPDTTISSCVIGLNLTPQLRLYYRDLDLTPVDQKYVAFSASGVSTTKITTDRGSSALANLDDEYEHLDAAETDDVAFIQAGGGLALRVEFPYLRQLKQTDNFYVTQAVLEIYTQRRSDSDLTPLPSTLVAYQIDRDNTILGQLDNGATLIPDLDLGRDTRYAMDVTAFVKYQMELQELNNNALLFRISDSYTSSVNRVYVTDASTYNTRLRIYYATLNNTVI